MSYAAAVHRGFGELTAAAALCLLLALALDHCALRGARETLVRGVTLILVAEAGLLLVSAHLRLVAYEEAYGYSLQRLYVRAHTVMTAISLALLAWEVCAGIDTGRLFRRLGLAAAIAVAVFSYWNHAAWVTAHDIGRYQRTGTVDIVYLTQELGDDAIPELIRSLPALRDPQAALARSRLEALKVAHAKEAEPHWYEWNLRRMTARRALAALPVP